MSVEIQKINQRLEGELIHGDRLYGVPFVLPGDKVGYRIIGRGKRRRIVLESIEPVAPEFSRYQRQIPFCDHFTKCGGCLGQYFSIEDQFQLKAGPYIDLIKSKFHLNTLSILPNQDRRYRNRMDFVVEADTIGLRPIGNYRGFVDIVSCKIQQEKSDLILHYIRSLIKQNPELPFHRKTKTGILKYVTIRQGKISGAVILTICKDTANEPTLHHFQNKLIELLKQFEQNHNYQFSLTQCEIGPLSETSAVEIGQVLYGQSFFEESLGPLYFQVPVDSFFQPNPVGFYKLFEAAIKEIEKLSVNSTISTIESIIDLYCGSAVLSLVFAKLLPSIQIIQGADFSKSGIELGKANIEKFNITNRTISFELQAIDLNRSPIQFQDSSLVIVDPPRAGLAVGVIEWLNWVCTSPLLLYISCNPMQQIKDIDSISNCYQPVFAAVTDPFPQTAHLESAVLLQRKATVE
ncbi:MAG: class I SAM-dependent RNA methyltransferase [Leptonema sp. (in: Bacteria)]|nr:class I SAM-dependent RNA methyltransferase [Leptonema sp. (in: bacteria)]